ncbi:glycosyltransferase family 4 protein [Rhodoplanes roseus]|uniref:Glycosyl transferase family 1 domain-containing protein n=1 Tax=Rhodoplanes roseus TaxID=29409 RepID=A0A327KTZ0_9BRAD|nr:glycosyltransferase family 1 protein [Rhodoplanes roseus]RAI42299.1 hypothetical protein CH341_19990 [Rhodoplanes roseus]
MSSPRILLDLSTTMRWVGPPVGILRVEGEYARFARRRLPNAGFVFFDPDDLCYRHVRDEAADAVLNEDAVIDTVGLPDPTGRRSHKTNIVPARLRPAALWVLRSRHQALMALERMRRTAPPPLARAAERIQRHLITDKDRHVMVRSDGGRRPVWSRRAALGPPVAFGPDDTLVCAGTGWFHTNIEAIARHKRETGFRLALLCYDIIPLLLPDCFQPHDTAMFRSYTDVAFPAADLVLVNARCTQTDVQAWCRAQGLPLARTAVVPLGADGPMPPSDDAAPPALPGGLEPGRYAMFVSTLEPRKNHRVLVDAWRRLIDAGVPQATGFRLVFVGRFGWNVEPLLKEIAADPRLVRSILHLPEAEDGLVAALYRGAAFCCYPSRYEGYGLPVIEAFRFGKAVLASTGGALPEVVAEFSPCIDPDDAEGWTVMLRRWIEDPSARALYEARIRTAFGHPGWDQAAAAFFAQVGGATGIDA